MEIFFSLCPFSLSFFFFFFFLLFLSHFFFSLLDPSLLSSTSSYRRLSQHRPSPPPMRSFSLSLAWSDTDPSRRTRKAPSAELLCSHESCVCHDLVRLAVRRLTSPAQPRASTGLSRPGPRWIVAQNQLSHEAFTWSSSKTHDAFDQLLRRSKIPTASHQHEKRVQAYES